MKKIAFVIQRYGEEVNGGSEQSCKQIAEQLSKYHQVEILTTKALEYTNWKDYYTKNEDIVSGVKVRRFSVRHRKFRVLFGLYKKLMSYRKRINISTEIRWMRLQGPTSYDLLDYINTHRDDYDVFIFFTYLYFPTYFGIQLVPEKSILVPTAHDEPYIYFSIFNSTFHLPRHIMYFTEEERDFVQKKFSNSYIKSDVSGLGVDIKKPNNNSTFKDKYNLYSKYIIYVGRIDKGKGCKQLFDFFIRYKNEEHASDVKLILLGKPVMPIPNHPDIISLGFVSDEDKLLGISESELLVLPSKYESLSMSVLESMYLKIPVLVNGECEVLAGHCRKGNGGLSYIGYNEFKEKLILLLNDSSLRSKLGGNGNNYVESNYCWENVIEKYQHAISYISPNN